MSESSEQIRWVTQTSNSSRLLYVLLAAPINVVAVMAVSFLDITILTILPKGFPPELLIYGTIWPIFLIFGASLYLIITGPDGSRPAQVEAAAGRLGLSFATGPDSDDLALPPEFPLARASAQWILPQRRGPRNLIYGEVGGRKVSMFDIAYPSNGRFETTAVYFPNPVPGLPDWPENWPRPGYNTGPPEPFASVLGPHPVWTVECRGGRLLLYRLYYLCHPESYPEFAAAATHVYAGIAAVAGGGASQGVPKFNFQDERLPDG